MSESFHGSRSLHSWQNSYGFSKIALLNAITILAMK